MGTDAAEVWDPGQALIALKQEQDAVGESTEIGLTELRLIRAAPVMADAIIHLAQYSSNERIRLSAAQYVLDRVLGKPKDGTTNAGPQDPFEKLMQACVVDVATKGRAIEVTSTYVAPADDQSEFIQGDESEDL